MRKPPSLERPLPGKKGASAWAGVPLPAISLARLIYCTVLYTRDPLTAFIADLMTYSTVHVLRFRVHSLDIPPRSYPPLPALFLSTFNDNLPCP